MGEMTVNWFDISAKDEERQKDINYSTFFKCPLRIKMHEFVEAPSVKRKRKRPTMVPDETFLPASFAPYTLWWIFGGLTGKRTPPMHMLKAVHERSECKIFDRDVYDVRNG
jgi:hypothetical protein